MVGIQVVEFEGTCESRFWEMAGRPAETALVRVLTVARVVRTWRPWGCAPGLGPNPFLMSG